MQLNETHKTNWIEGNKFQENIHRHRATDNKLTKEKERPYIVFFLLHSTESRNKKKKKFATSFSSSWFYTPNTEKQHNTDRIVVVVVVGSSEHQFVLTAFWQARITVLYSLYVLENIRITFHIAKKRGSVVACRFCCHLLQLYN